MEKKIDKKTKSSADVTNFQFGSGTPNRARGGSMHNSPGKGSRGAQLRKGTQ